MGYTPAPASSACIHVCLKYPAVVIILGLAVAGIAIPGFNPPANNCTKAMITFTFDEGHMSALDQAYPILEKYGYTGTAFVVTDWIGTSGHMSMTDLWVLQREGWEIGSQGKTYTDLTTLDNTSLIEEISESKTYLESNYLHVWGFASPYGAYDKTVIDLISTQYLYHRTLGPDGLNDLPLKNESDAYELRVVNVTSKTTVQEVKDWMIKAKSEGKWLILVFHDIDGQDANSWSSDNLEEIAKFARDNEFEGIWTERPITSTMALYDK